MSAHVLLAEELASAIRRVTSTSSDTTRYIRAASLAVTTSMQHREIMQRVSSQAITKLISGGEVFADASQFSISYRGSPLAGDLDETQ